MARRLRETRTVTTPLEVRTDESGALRLDGYAALFDSPAHDEVVRRGAFARTLDAGADVRLLVNHDGVPLARTKSGTLTLSTDDVGLRAHAELDPANPTVAELTSALARGDIDQMSFAFETVQESRSDDGLRELNEVRLWDVSVVTYPWYEDTSVELLSALGELVEARGVDAALQTLRSHADPAAAEESVVVIDEVIHRHSQPQAPAVRTAAARAIWDAAS